jgi:hypothetical protein
MPDSPDHARAQARAFWLGLAFWIGVCLLAVLVRGVRWEEGYERAQVLLGITPYPEGHPHHRWVFNGFSIHYYATGALLWLTESAALICGGRQFLATLAIHLPIFGVTWLLTRRMGPVHLALVLSFAGADVFFQSYMPISPWATKATSGIMGMGWAFAVLLALAAERWRMAGILFGLMPLIHLGQWPMILLTAITSGVWLWWHGERAALKQFVACAAIGLAITVVFAIAQRPFLVPDPVVGAYHAETDGHAIWAEYTTNEDMHRKRTEWPRFGLFGHSVIGLAGFLVLALPVVLRAWKSPTQRGPVLVLFTYAALSTAAIAFAWTVHALMDTDVPYIVVSWMPYRLVIHVAMLLMAAMCAWSAGRGGALVALVSLAWLAAIPLWPHVIDPELAARYFATPETTLFLLAGASILGLWRDMEVVSQFRRAWLLVLVVGLLALAWYHKVAAASVLCGLVLALAGDRIVWKTWMPRAGGIAAYGLGALALIHVFAGQWRMREHLPVSPFEAEMAKYLAEHSAPSDMVLTTLEEHWQMVLNRPVVATFETRQFMSYMKSIAATTDKLFADLYGVKDGRWYDWDLWQRRTEAEWRALGNAYGFRYVVSKDFHPLHLPIRLQGEGLVLYEVPGANMSIP